MQDLAMPGHGLWSNKVLVFAGRGVAVNITALHVDCVQH